MNATMVRDRILVTIAKVEPTNRTIIADYVGSHRPTVSKAIDRLTTGGYVVFDGSFKLTEKGDKAAWAAADRMLKRIGKANEVLKKDGGLLRLESDWVEKAYQKAMEEETAKAYPPGFVPVAPDQQEGS